jgi:hypothetical protein
MARSFLAQEEQGTDGRHLPACFGDLDPACHEDDASLDRIEERLEDRKSQARPSAGQRIEVERPAVETIEQAIVTTLV